MSNRLSQGLTESKLWEPVRTIQENWQNRPRSLSDLTGVGQRSFSDFGTQEYFDSKYRTNPDPDGTVSWRGISGIFQFITKFPFGYMFKSDWAIALNQILWNLIFFIVIPGAIYGAMIKAEAISVPDGIKEKTPNPYAQGFYFAVVTMTTLGFGDISPGTVGGQIVVMFHILLFFMFNFIWTLDFDPSNMS